MSSFGLYRVPTLPISIFNRGRTALLLAFIMIALSIVSLVTGVTGGRYIYSIATNIVPVLLPLIVREGTRGSLWGLDLLSAQCVLGVVYSLVVIILDAIILAFISAEFKYCIGSWQDRCKAYHGTGTIDLVCDSSGLGTTPVELFITCQTQDVYIMQFLSLSVNLLHGVLVGPYLFLCQCMRFALARYHWENGYLLELHRLTAKTVVILGSEEELDIEGEVPVPGLSVGKQRHNAYTEESRDEAMQSRNYLTVTNRSAIRDTSTLK